MVINQATSIHSENSELTAVVQLIYISNVSHKYSLNLHTIKTNPCFKIKQLHWQECIICTRTVTAPLQKLKYIHTFNASMNVYLKKKILQWAHPTLLSKTQELRIQTQENRIWTCTTGRWFTLKRVLKPAIRSLKRSRHNTLLRAAAFTGSF